MSMASVTNIRYVYGGIWKSPQIRCEKSKWWAFSGKRGETVNYWRRGLLMHRKAPLGLRAIIFVQQRRETITWYILQFVLTSSWYPCNIFVMIYWWKLEMHHLSFLPSLFIIGSVFGSVCVCASVLLCVYTQVRVFVCVCFCVYVQRCVSVCLTLKGRMQIADEYAAAPYREMIAWFCLWRRDHPLWRRFIVKPQKWQKLPLSGVLYNRG